MRTHIFTSITANYLPKARVLANSVKRFHPDFRFHLVLSDATPPGFKLAGEPFDSLIEIADLGIPNQEQWLFQHSLVEVSTGVKGFALLQILELPDCSEVMYFDPDIVLLAPLDGLLQEFRTASVLLTPHICHPEESTQAILDNEFSVLRHGIFNLGFVGVKNSPEGLRFAHWWKDRLHHFCFDDIPNGIFTDQRWVDLAPTFFPDHRVLRDPVYNVSTWNLTHRKVEGDLRHGVHIQGQPVIFYHFSGLDSGAQEAMLDKYGATMPVLYELRSWYLAECDRMGQEALGRTPWHYATFENGEKIHPLHRQRYKTRTDLQHAFPNPYLTSDVSRSFYHWFEAHDESRARPRPAERDGIAGTSASMRPTPVPAATYRIFFSVSGADPKVALEEAALLSRSAYAQDQLHLIGPANIVDALMKDGKISTSFAAVRLKSDEGHAGSFREVLQRFHDSDFLFLACGVRIPPMGDLRLSWAAYRHEHAATVSPVSCLGKVSPFQIGPIPGLSNPTLEVIDRACYDCSHFEMSTLNSFRSDCVFVRGEAVRTCCSAGVAEPDTFTNFAQASIYLRYSHLLADHVCTEFALEDTLPLRTGALPPAAMVQVAHQSERLVRYFMTRPSSALPISSAAKPRQLHVMHSWGGGLEHWVKEYCRTDLAHDNFVLKSVGDWGAFGSTLQLFRSPDDTQPIRTWQLTPAVSSTVIAHDGYRAALFDIIGSLGIDLVMVSSLIGHSLDVLASGLPTFVICHDYFPFCPALNISFNGVCRSCTPERLASCTVDNPHNRYFLNVPSSHWPSVRAAFAQIVNRQQCTLIAPSDSVRAHYKELAPDLADRITVLPHGAHAISSEPLKLRLEPESRLRIVVLGSIAPHKGRSLLQEMMPQLAEFADLYLVGCGAENIPRFEGVQGVTIIPKYQRAELPDILEKINPHLGLLLSVVPETFSFTLQELLELAIPVVCTRIGSFADRIEHSVSGFLCEPVAGEIIARLRGLHEDREPLCRIHALLAKLPRRSLQDMLDNYQTLSSLPEFSAKAYFAPRGQPRDQVDRACSTIRWRVKGEEFNNTNSSVEFFATGTAEHSLRFVIPPSTVDPFELRLDPADRLGSMLVRRLAVNDKHGATLWLWDGDAGRIGKSMREEIEFLPAPDGGAGSLIHFFGGHPRFVMPVDSSICEKLREGGVVEFDYTWFPPDRTSLQLDWAKVLVGVRNGSGKYESQANTLQTELDAARIDLEHVSRRVADLENSLSWRWSSPLRIFGNLMLTLSSRVRRSGEPTVKPDNGL